MTGTLRWGVKRSFRAYVDAAGGRAAGSAVEQAGEGPFTFHQVDADDGGLRYSGQVDFTAHGGMLSVRIVDPGIERTADHVYLTVTDPDHLPATDRRIRIARLTLPADELEGAWRDVPARLTVHGSMLFGGTYPVGTDLDPVTFSDGAA